MKSLGRIAPLFAVLILLRSRAPGQEPPAFELGFVERAAFALVLPAGERPGLALVQGDCGGVRGDVAGRTFRAELWCTLTSRGGSPAERPLGWSLGVRGEGLRVTGIGADPLFSRQRDRGGFERSELTSGAQNEGGVSSVTLSLDDSIALPASGTAPLATVSVESDIPPLECSEARLEFVDGLVDSGGRRVTNSVRTGEGAQEVVRGGCGYRVCLAPPGEEVCDNGTDDDGDGSIDLDDADCADFPDPGDCVFFPCSCRFPFELFFAKERVPVGLPAWGIDLRAGLRFSIVSTSPIPLSGFQFGVRSRPDGARHVFELTGELADAAGEPLDILVTDPLGNPIPPEVGGRLTAATGRIEDVVRGADLEPPGDRGFFSLDLSADPGGSRFTVRYAADLTGGAPAIPPNVASKARVAAVQTVEEDSQPAADWNLRAGYEVSRSPGMLRIARLPSRLVRCCIVAPGYREAWSEAVLLRDDAEVEAPPLRFEPGRTIRVRLKTPDGGALPEGVYFRAWREPTDEGLQSFVRFASERVPGEPNAFALSGFPSGTYRLRVDRTGIYSAPRTTVVVDDADAAVTITLDRK